jgi:hypothetical protein
VSVSRGVAIVTFDVTVDFLNIRPDNNQDFSDIILAALAKIIASRGLAAQLVTEAQQSALPVLQSPYAIATLHNFTSAVSIVSAYRSAAPTVSPTNTFVPTAQPTSQATRDVNSDAVNAIASAGSSAYWSLVLLLLLCFLIPLCIFCCRHKKAHKESEETASLAAPDDATSQPV